MTDVVMIIWLVTENVTFLLPEGVTCDDQYKYLEEIERITYDIPYTYLDGVQMIGYVCGIL